MEQIDQLKAMRDSALERLRNNPDYKLVHSLENLIADLEATFAPIEAETPAAEEDNSEEIADADTATGEDAPSQVDEPAAESEMANAVEADSAETAETTETGNLETDTVEAESTENELSDSNVDDDSWLQSSVAETEAAMDAEPSQAEPLAEASAEETPVDAEESRPMETDSDEAGETASSDEEASDTVVEPGSDPYSAAPASDASAVAQEENYTDDGVQAPASVNEDDSGLIEEPSASAPVMEAPVVAEAPIIGEQADTEEMSLESSLEAALDDMLAADGAEPAPVHQPAETRVESDVTAGQQSTGTQTEDISQHAGAVQTALGEEAGESLDTFRSGVSIPGAASGSGIPSS